MHLLMIDSDLTSARHLHGEFLDYRGLNWDLTHCESHAKAIPLLEHESYQAILYRTDANLEQITHSVQELVHSPTCPPIVAVANDLDWDQQLHLVKSGCDDILLKNSVDGLQIMRSLRLAEKRATLLEQPIGELTDEDRKLRIARLANGTSLISRLPGDLSDFEFENILSIEAIVERLDADPKSFDALLMEQSIFEQSSTRVLRILEPYLSQVPSLVLTLEKSDFAALTYLQQGHRDCLVVDECTSDTVALALRKLVVRHHRKLVEFQASGKLVNDRRAKPRGGQNRRRHTRFFLETSVVAIPVLANGGPDLEGRTQAETIDVSLDGIGIKLPNRDQLPSRNWVLGIAQGENRVAYISAFLRRVAYRGEDLNVGMVFQQGNDDFLHQNNLWPTIHSQTMRFETKIPASFLDQWVQLGVLQKRLVRRARVCPDCEAVSTVGLGCSQCGAFQLGYRDLIHHFPCAHVAHAEAFQQGNRIQCPKCLGSDLVAGADFEVIRSQYHCPECDYEGDQTAEVGCCLNCQLRFPIGMAPEVEINSYDVERLDVLALVDSAR